MENCEEKGVCVEENLSDLSMPPTNNNKQQKAGKSQSSASAAEKIAAAVAEENAEKEEVETQSLSQPQLLNPPKQQTIGDRAKSIGPPQATTGSNDKFRGTKGTTKPIDGHAKTTRTAKPSSSNTEPTDYEPINGKLSPAIDLAEWKRNQDARINAENQRKLKKLNRQSIDPKSIQKVKNSIQVSGNAKVSKVSIGGHAETHMKQSRNDIGRKTKGTLKSIDAERKPGRTTKPIDVERKPGRTTKPIDVERKTKGTTKPIDSYAKAKRTTKPSSNSEPTDYEPINAKLSSAKATSKTHGREGTLKPGGKEGTSKLVGTKRTPKPRRKEGTSKPRDTDENDNEPTDYKPVDAKIKPEQNEEHQRKAFAAHMNAEKKEKLKKAKKQAAASSTKISRQSNDGAIHVDGGGGIRVDGKRNSVDNKVKHVIKKKNINKSG